MPDLDPVRTPNRAGYFRLLTVAVAVAMGLMVSMEWWLANPMPRGLIAAAVSAVIGAIVGRAVFRRKMFDKK